MYIVILEHSERKYGRGFSERPGSFSGGGTIVLLPSSGCVPKESILLTSLQQIVYVVCLHDHDVMS